MMKKRRGVLWLVLVAGLVLAAAEPDATETGDAAITTLPAAPEAGAGEMQADAAATAQPVTAAAVERGLKKFADKCNITNDCSFEGAVCDPETKTCQCTPDLPATNHIDKCGKLAEVNESCFFNEQCEMKLYKTECKNDHCMCRYELSAFVNKDGSIVCIAQNEEADGSVKYIDPAMIGVLVGMALMFVIICVVLRLFSKARWRENRTIFNTPNPRLMNVSLLRDSKLLHSNEQRRGSRASVRAPSRQPSMASLRPHSPNESPGSRRGSKGSNTSATSKSPTKTHGNQTPVVENVTVEIQDPKV